jgi:hypothetical protein
VTSFKTELTLTLRWGSLGVGGLREDRADAAVSPPAWPCVGVRPRHCRFPVAPREANDPHDHGVLHTRCCVALFPAFLPRRQPCLLQAPTAMWADSHFPKSSIWSHCHGHPGQPHSSFSDSVLHGSSYGAAGTSGSLSVSSSCSSERHLCWDHPT